MNPALFGSCFKPHFFHYMKPYMIHFQDGENLKGKPKIHEKIVNEKCVFHKTPSSHFLSDSDLFCSNPLSLKFSNHVFIDYDRFN